MTKENETSANKESFYHLEICCQYIEKKYNELPSATWTNADYLRLSSILSRQTNVQISSSTLKRIFGKLKTPERYYPQKATRDALSGYAGFTDWEHFISQHPRPAKPVEKKQPMPVMEVTSQPVMEFLSPSFITGKHRWWFRAFLGLVVFGAIGALVWRIRNGGTGRIPSPGQIKLICHNPVGESPHSAVFELRLPDDFSGQPDGFTLDFGNGRREKAIAGNTQVVQYYEIPGRYYPILKYNHVGIDTETVYLESKGWTATATRENDTVRVYPVVSGELFANGQLQVSPLQLSHAGVDTNHTFFVDFVNTRPTTIDGDNFELTADVRASKERPGVRCSQVYVTVFGEHSKFNIPAIKPGCVSWINLQLSEIYKGGDGADLSPFGADLSNSGRIRLLVVDKLAMVYINDRQVYRARYTVSIGKIYGTMISFSGIGSVQGLVLRDLKTGELFHDGFPVF